MDLAIQIDGFRFIDHLHTTARQLPVFTEIICLLNNKQLHKRILESLLEDWSKKEEQKNDLYKSSKGKVTNDNKRTIALRYHLEASTSLGLIVKHNDLFINSKFARLFFQILKDENLKHRRNDVEFIFYLYYLLMFDADGIILCLNQLADKKQKSQVDLQNDFKRALNERLVLKQAVGKSNAKAKISEKYKSINYIWRKPEKYAEHIIAPRYEWLAYLELVEIKRESRKTLYSLTEKGHMLMHNLPSSDEAGGIKDITNEWINENFFSLVSCLDYKIESNFPKLQIAKQNQVISEALERAMKTVQSSMSFKLTIRESFFFICIDLLIRNKILINFNDIRVKLKSDFHYNKKAYLLKESGRLNEGYITITNIK